jgi:hypothetical protein
MGLQSLSGLHNLEEERAGTLQLPNKFEVNSVTR